MRFVALPDDCEVGRGRCLRSRRSGPGRRGEQDIIECWERELDVTFERRLANGRVGIGRPGAAFTV
jgi:hypothetical protein